MSSSALNSSSRTQLMHSVDLIQVNGIHYIVVCFQDATKIYNGIDHSVVQVLNEKPPNQAHICKLTGHLVIVSEDSILVYLCDRGHKNSSRFQDVQWLFSRELAIFGPLSNAEVTFSYPLCSFNFMGSVTVFDVLAATSASYLRDESGNAGADTKAFEMATLSPNSTYLSAIESDAEDSSLGSRQKQNIFRLYLFFLPREVFIPDMSSGCEDSGFMFFSKRAIAKSDLLATPHMTPIKNERTLLPKSPADADDDNDEARDSSIENKLLTECLSTVLHMGKHRICCHSWRVANQYSQQLFSKRDQSKRVSPMMEMFLTFDIVGCLKIWSVLLAEPTDNFAGSGSFNISKDGSMTLEVNQLSSMMITNMIPGFEIGSVTPSLSRVNWVLAPNTCTSASKPPASAGKISHQSSTVSSVGPDLDASAHSPGYKIAENEMSAANQISAYPVGWLIVTFPFLIGTVETNTDNQASVHGAAGSGTIDSARRRPSGGSNMNSSAAMLGKQKIRDRDSTMESRVTVDASALTGIFFGCVFKVESGGHIAALGSPFKVSSGVPRSLLVVSNHQTPPSYTKLQMTPADKVLFPWNIVANVYAVCRFQSFNQSHSFGVPNEIDILHQFGDLDVTPHENADLSCMQTQYAGAPKISTEEDGFLFDSSMRHDEKNLVKSPFYCLPSRRLLKAVKLKARFGSEQQESHAAGHIEASNVSEVAGVHYGIQGMKELVSVDNKGDDAVLLQASHSSSNVVVNDAVDVQSCATGGFLLPWHTNQKVFKIFDAFARKAARGVDWLAESQALGFVVFERIASDSNSHSQMNLFRSPRNSQISVASQNHKPEPVNTNLLIPVQTLLVAKSIVVSDDNQERQSEPDSQLLLVLQKMPASGRFQLVVFEDSESLNRSHRVMLPPTSADTTPFSSARVDNTYFVRIILDPKYGMGMKIEAGEGGGLIIGGFKKHPATGEPMFAESLGSITVGDHLLSVEDVDLQGKSLAEGLQSIRTVIMGLQQSSTEPAEGSSSRGTVSIGLKLEKKAAGTVLEPAIRRKSESKVAAADSQEHGRQESKVFKRRHSARDDITSPGISNHQSSVGASDHCRSWVPSGTLVLPLGTVDCALLLSDHGKLIVSVLKSEGNESAAASKISSLEEMFSSFDKESATSTSKAETKVKARSTTDWTVQVQEVIIRKFSKRLVDDDAAPLQSHGLGSLSQDSHDEHKAPGSPLSPLRNLGAKQLSLSVSLKQRVVCRLQNVPFTKQCHWRIQLWNCRFVQFEPSVLSLGKDVISVTVVASRKLGKIMAGDCVSVASANMIVPGPAPTESGRPRNKDSGSGTWELLSSVPGRTALTPKTPAKSPAKSPASTISAVPMVHFLMPACVDTGTSGDTQRSLTGSSWRIASNRVSGKDHRYCLERGSETESSSSGGCVSVTVDLEESLSSPQKMLKLSDGAESISVMRITTCNRKNCEQCLSVNALYILQAPSEFCDNDNRQVNNCAANCSKSDVTRLFQSATLCFDFLYRGFGSSRHCSAATKLSSLSRLIDCQSLEQLVDCNGTGSGTLSLRPVSKAIFDGGNGNGDTTSDSSAANSPQSEGVSPSVIEVDHYSRLLDQLFNVINAMIESSSASNHAVDYNRLVNLVATFSLFHSSKLIRSSMLFAVPQKDELNRFTPPFLQQPKESSNIEFQTHELLVDRLKLDAWAVHGLLLAGLESGVAKGSMPTSAKTAALSFEAALSWLHTSSSSQHCIFSTLVARPVEYLLSMQPFRKHLDAAAATLQPVLFPKIVELRSQQSLIIVNSDSMDHVQDSCIDVLGILTDFRVALWMRDLTAAGSLIEKAAIDNFRKRKSAMDVSQTLSF
jgi:hypothetical protein